MAASHPVLSRLVAWVVIPHHAKRLDTLPRHTARPYNNNCALPYPSAFFGCGRLFHDCRTGSFAEPEICRRWNSIKIGADVKERLIAQSADAKVTVVEFFDYQCIYCARLAPELEKVIKANPDVRFVFKEFPIFGQRWPASLSAAKTGLQIWKQKGADAYLHYHNAIYATAHNEGKLTDADISAAAKAVKFDAKTAPDVQGTLDGINTLAQQLGRSGTPAPASAGDNESLRPATLPVPSLSTGAASPAGLSTTTMRALTDVLTGSEGSRNVPSSVFRRTAHSFANRGKA